MTTREREGLLSQWDLGEGYQIEMHRWLPDTDFDHLRPLQERAAAVNDRVFRLNPLQTAEEILHHMKRGMVGTIMIAVAEGVDIGICIQKLVRVPTLSGGRGENVVWTALRAVEQGHQQRNVATEFLQKGFEEYARYRPRYYTGRSQAEPIFLTFEDAVISVEGRTVREFDLVYPTQRLYEEYGEARDVIWHIAPRTLNSVPVNLRTGLAIGLYREGKTGGYTPNLEHPGYRRINAVFERVKLNKQRGDTIYYVARVNQAALELLRAA